MADKNKQPQDVNAYQRDYMARRRASARDIKEIPPVANPSRRLAGSQKFASFCETYFPEQFTLPWSQYHFRAADKIERATVNGGFFAFAMPRGSGKTTICRWGVLWAVLNGHCDYVVLIGASERAAEKQLRNIRTMLCRNPLLMADYPEAGIPIRQIMYDAVLPSKQTYQGQPTCVDWQVNRLVMPWIPLDREQNHASRGAVIEVMGITSEIRGLNHVRPDNATIRPRLALCDDPQTRESAKSIVQSRTRMETLSGDVAYLAGPGSPIAVVCPCTVIYEGDLADQILNREVHPEWQGERTKMVEAFPTNVEWWDKYADELRDSLRNERGLETVNAMYAKDRKIADAGASVSWPERYRDDELSAIQHAMNLKIRDEASFFAECQNEPLISQSEFEVISADELCKKTTGHERGIVPDECSAITAFTDVQMEHLFWMVCAWTPDMTGYIIDYGASPDQKRNYFTRRDVRHKMSQRYAGDENGVMFAALTDLGNKLAGTSYTKLSGGELGLSKWCIDKGWRSTPVTAYAVQSEYRNIIALTRGFGVKASALTPFNEAERAKRWKSTHGHWFWSDGPGPAKSVRMDVNHWKTRVHRALLLPTNSKGSIQLFKGTPTVHRMIADHITAERATKVESHNRIVFEWDAIPGRDNEGLDCLVGCAVAASIHGIIPDAEIVRPRAAAPLSLSDYAKLAGR